MCIAIYIDPKHYSDIGVNVVQQMISEGHIQSERTSVSILLRAALYCKIIIQCRAGIQSMFGDESLLQNRNTPYLTSRGTFHYTNRYKA